MCRFTNFCRCFFESNFQNFRLFFNMELEGCDEVLGRYYCEMYDDECYGNNHNI